MQFSVYLLPALFTALLSLAIFILGWRKPRRVELATFYWLTLGVLIWSTALIFEYGLTSLGAKLSAANCKYIGVGLTLTMWFALAVQYTNRDHLLTRRAWLLLAIEPILFVALAFTNDLHGLIRQSVGLVETNGVLFLTGVSGIGFWLHFVYAYGLMVASTGLILRTFRRPLLDEHSQTLGLISAILTPWLANVLYFLGITPVDLTTLGFAQIGLVLLYGGYRVRPRRLGLIARETIVENMRDGVLVLDKQKQVIDMNHAVRRIFELEADEGIGQPLAEVFARRPHLIRQLEAYTLSRREIALDTPDGTRYYEITFAPLTDPEGESYGQIVMFYDITERHRALEALRENQSRIRLMMSQMPAVLWTTDADLTMTSVMGSVLGSLNLDAARVVGRSMRDIFSVTDDADPAITAHLDALAGKSGKYEYEFRGRFFEVYVEPLRSYEQQIIGGLSIALDVTSRRQAERRDLELAAERERVRALSEFIRDISHDFKTPLSTINARLYLIDKLDEAEQRAVHAGAIKQQTDRLARLLEDMLTMLRLDTGLELTLRRDDFNRLADDLHTLYLHAAAHRGLDFTAALQPDLPPGLFDRAQMLLALRKLMDNALAYTPAGGRIALETYQHGPYVALEIRDTGIGIAPEEQEQIFSRFYRADKARSTETGGVGLGLPVARKIIEVHGGTIEVESALGAGSTFRVMLPMAVESSQPRPSTKVSPRATQA